MNNNIAPKAKTSKKICKRAVTHDCDGGMHLEDEEKSFEVGEILEVTKE